MDNPEWMVGLGSLEGVVELAFLEERVGPEIPLVVVLEQSSMSAAQVL